MNSYRKVTADYWPDDYIAKRRSAENAIKLIKPGQRIFIGSSCGEPLVLSKELNNQASNFTDLEIVRVLRQEVSLMGTGDNQEAYGGFNVRYFYLGSAKPHSLAQIKRFITPINLSAVPRLFKSRQLPIHVALIQVSEPDDFGWMSLGVSVDVTLAAAQTADLVIAQVNPKMPRVLGRSFIHVNEVDVIVEHEEELLTIGHVPDFEAAHLIAQYAAKLIEDGSTMQMSLGTTHQGLLTGLSQKNDLGIHTQFLSDSIMQLVSMGVINNRKKGFNEGKLVASGAIGSKNLYEFLHDNPSIEFHPSDYVNNPTIIAQHNKMVALNVVMAMDLTGQVAADALPYNHFSGVNGIMDFIRGASLSPGGKNILLLPSTTMDGKSSRIVPSLEDIPVIVPRAEVQYVVTEYGVVNLFGKNLQERAIAMISIAHPNFRDELFYKAKEMGLLGKERTLADSIRSVYPLNIEETRVIKGQQVLFRPAKPTDERKIQEHFYNLDRQDVVRRFLHEKTSFVRDEMADVYQVDYIHDMTIVAVIGEVGFEEIIAVGGYFIEPARNMAEVAFSVAKDWQGKGVSSIIQEKLAKTAREHGIRGLVAYTTTNNMGMIKLFKRLPFRVKSAYDDVGLILTANFDEPIPTKIPIA
ncbi:MAG: GNAT family N-acetyltransferase [Deltaproteobacteria bacterium]|nr:GNAT family N-acetyltransferase [Deltaproteobacteria bacterium]